MKKTIVFSNTVYEIDCHNRMITSKNGRVMKIGGRAWEVLSYLMQRPGVTIDIKELHKGVWGNEVQPGTALKQLSILRNQIFCHPHIIHSRKNEVRFDAHVSNGGATEIGDITAPDATRASKKDIIQQLGAGLSKTKEEAWFFGTNFHVTTEHFRDELLDAARSGIKIHFLTLCPNSILLPYVARSFSMSTSSLKHRCDSTVEDLHRLQRQVEVENVAGKFEFKLYDLIPFFRAYFIDPFCGGRTYIVPYIMNLDPADAPGYWMPIDDPMAIKPLSSITELWKTLA